MAKLTGDSRCVVCSNRVHVVIDDYMVKDSVWNEADLKDRDNVHLPCLEKLIKRHLVFEDFTDFPINDKIRWALHRATAETSGKKHLYFMECESCVHKPGSPVLCRACLHNRATIEDLQGADRNRENNHRR